jgi:hypothetical protein
MKINGAKWYWFATKIQLLGHIVSSDSVAMNLEKVLAIHELKYPKNVKDVQRFLVWVAITENIHNNAKITEPLTN